jgi:uncharacterized protein
MIVEQLSREECLKVLAEAPVARLACAAGNQPYIVPMYLAYHQAPDGEDCLYGFTTIGQKVQWLRKNPLACVEVDEISSRSQWMSVVAFGRYEELSNIHERPVGRAPERHSPADAHGPPAATSEPFNEQLFAHQLLEARAMWWEPAYSVRTNVVRNDEPSTDLTPVFYKIHLTEVTGDRARHESEPTSSMMGSAEPVPSTHVGWLQGALARWRRNFKRNGTSVDRANSRSVGSHEDSITR